MAKSENGSEKSPTGELFATLKKYFNQLSEGEKSPIEVASAFNQLARDGADTVKARISEEVESQVAKMGFIKREEYDALLKRVAKLEKAPKKTAKATAKKVKKADKK